MPHTPRLVMSTREARVNQPGTGPGANRPGVFCGCSPCETALARPPTGAEMSTIMMMTPTIWTRPWKKSVSVTAR